MTRTWPSFVLAVLAFTALVILTISDHTGRPRPAFLITPPADLSSVGTPCVVPDFGGLVQPGAVVVNVHCGAFR